MAAICTPITDGDMAVDAGWRHRSCTPSPMRVLPAMPTCADDAAMAADADVVANLHQIIDLRAFADHRVVHRAAIDRRIGADLDLSWMMTRPICTILIMPPRGPGA